MTWVLAIVAGLAGAVLGWLVTGALAVWIAGLAGMSDFEGGRGMFAFLGVGPIGGLVAALGSSWLVLRHREGRAPVWPTLRRLVGALGGMAMVVGAGIALRLLTLDTYTNEAPPSLEFEVRMPDGLAPRDRSALRIELHTDRNVDEAVFTDPPSASDPGHQVIAGVVPLAFKTRARLLVVSLPDQPTRLFRLALSRNPGSTPALGAWEHATHLARPDDAEPVGAPKDDPVEIRYRVRRAGED